MTRLELVAKFGALAAVADTHLVDPRALYFDPTHIADLFTRAAGLMDALRKKFPTIFDDLPVRQIPVPSRTTDFEGRGCIHRDQIETVRRDLRYCVDVLVRLPADVVDPPGRPKGEKFGILDAPRLKETDLPESLGVLGVAVIYLDIDDFKRLNTKYTELVVDETILPEFQKLIAEATDRHGHAYAEGGDEVVIILRNFSPAMATSFANDLLDRIRKTAFAVKGGSENITVSAGLAVAASATDLPFVANRANEAKKEAKHQGRDRLVTWRSSGDGTPGIQPSSATR